MAKMMYRQMPPPPPPLETCPNKSPPPGKNQGAKAPEWDKFLGCVGGWLQQKLIATSDLS